MIPSREWARRDAGLPAQSSGHPAPAHAVGLPAQVAEQPVLDPDAVLPGLAEGLPTQAPGGGFSALAEGILALAPSAGLPDLAPAPIVGLPAQEAEQPVPTRRHPVPAQADGLPILWQPDGYRDSREETIGTDAYRGSQVGEIGRAGHVELGQTEARKDEVLFKLPHGMDGDGMEFESKEFYHGKVGVGKKGTNYTQQPFCYISCQLELIRKAKMLYLDGSLKLVSESFMQLNQILKTSLYLCAIFLRLQKLLKIIIIFL